MSEGVSHRKGDGMDGREDLRLHNESSPLLSSCVRPPVRVCRVVVVVDAPAHTLFTFSHP